MNAEPSDRSQHPVISWVVSRIDEDQKGATVYFERTNWVTVDDGEVDLDLAVQQAEPGHPWGEWDQDRNDGSMVLRVGRLASAHYDVGRHYTMGLTEIVDVGTGAGL